MAKGREKLLARKMRRGGESIRAIAKSLGVSKGSVSLWCRDIVLSREQVLRLVKRDVAGGMLGRMKAWEWHKQEKRERYKKYHTLGYGAVVKLGEYELFLTGLALYWAEGSKRDGRVLLTNSDPQMIQLYIRWLKECFKIEPREITCRITINELHRSRKEEIEMYWSGVTGIPITQFTKTTMIHSKWTKSYENRKTYYGVLAVHVQRSTNLSYRVMGSIDRLREIGSVMI